MDSDAKRLRLACLLSMALIAGASCFSAQAAQSNAYPESYSLAPGKLDEALSAFAQHYRVQIAYSPALVAHRTTEGFSQAVDVREGLAQLLRDTGLTAVAVRPGVYLLTASPRPAGAKAAPRKTAPTTQSTAPVELDSVHVTGSRISRAELQSSLPTAVIDQEQIRSSGYQTLFDLLRNQPGMAGHHPLDVATEGGGSQIPVAAAASTSLYSLGPRATLFLVDGRRIASYGLVSSDLGGLSDLNGIPLSMVDRVEIVRGGVSAIYGADAMAGVVNIILKKDYRGAEVGLGFGRSDRSDAAQQRQYASLGLQMPGDGHLFLSADRFVRDGLLGAQRPRSSLDQRRYGGQDHRIPYAYFTDSYEPQFVPGCADMDATAHGMDCGFDPTRWTSLQPGLRSTAVYAHYRQPLGDNVELYAEVRATDVDLDLRGAPSHGVMPLPDDHPDAIGPRSFLNYWFADVGPIRNRVATDTLDYAVGASGKRAELEWDVNMSYHRNQVRSRIDGLIGLPAIGKIIRDRSYRFTGSEPNPPGILRELSPRIGLSGEMSIYTVSGNLETPLFELPSGTARGAMGFEARHEHTRTLPDTSLLSGNIAMAQNFSTTDAARSTAAVYAELDVPILKNLWLNAAARVDHSSGYASELSPMFGLRWQPWRPLILRASFGEGYRAPSLAELREPFVGGGADKSGYIEESSVSAPCRESYEGLCRIKLGTRINQQLRPETSRSRSVGLAWTPLKRLSIGVDRYRIRRKNEILQVDALSDPSRYPEALVTDADGYLIGIDTYFDNIGRTDVGGWQLDIEQGFGSERWGDFVVRLSGHYQDRMRVHLTRETQQPDSFVPGLSKVVAVSSVSWKRSDWTTTLNLRYTGHSSVWVPYASPTFFVNEAIESQRRLPSTTLTNLNLAYGGFRDWLLTMNIDNLADRTPLNVNYRRSGRSVADQDVVGRYYWLSAQRRF